jgi:hypothetical protein
MIVTDGGMQNDFSVWHSKKVPCSSVWRLDPGSKANEYKLEQCMKHPSPIERTRFGIQMEGSDEQHAKTDLSIVTSRDSDSNVTADSDEHEWKHSTQRISTDAGMQIERSKVQLANAASPIVFKRETGRNVNETRADSRKHNTPRDSIDEATQNDGRG